MEEPKRALKRKAPDCMSDDGPSERAPKARLSAKSKVKAASQASDSENGAVLEQPGPSSLQINPSIGRLSCLPPEVINMIIEKIDDKISLKNLTITSKALYSLARPQLFRRIERSCEVHAHITKFIKATEPFLSIEQRIQLKTEGVYKGQQETFLDGVDPRKKPELARYIRQSLLEIGNPGPKHRYIVHRYVEELLKNLDNLELLGITLLTESIAKKLTMKKSLKALYLHISLPVNAGFEDGGVLNTLKGLQHLSLYKEAFWDSNAWNKVGAEMLIWNSRSTIRSIELNESIFHRMHCQWEEAGDKPPRQGYLSALKSFSVIWGIFDHEETDAITQAIDFIKLDELKLGRGNTGTGLLYRRLINAFSTARKGDIRLGSLHMDLAVDRDDGIDFLASFDTLTRLSICDSGVHIADSQDYSLDDSLLRGLFMHKNLTTLKLTDKNSNLEGDRKLELDAQMVSKFIINLPNLRHLHFYFDERQLKEIAESLSHGKELEKICAKTHTWGFSYDKRLDTARTFLHYLARPVLEHGSDQANFRWEDHTKIKHVVCNRVKFEVGSRLEKTKGVKKALTIESPWDSKRQMLYRHVLGNPTIMKQGIDVMRKWADKVARDLD